MFNALIPLPFYTPLYFHAMLALVLITVLKLQTSGLTFSSNIKKEYGSFLLLVVVVLYMGLRPISYTFGDMGMYAFVYSKYQNGMTLLDGHDVLWNFFMKTCSAFMEAKSFFLLCAVLYCLPLYAAVKKWVQGHSFFLLLALFISFSFWSYGTNGIRNGIATSLFIWALSLDKKVLKYVLFFLAYSIHGSILIPLAAYILTIFYKNPYHYLAGWLIAVPLSLAMGGVWESLFAGLGFAGERAAYLTDATTADQFAATGFRWDFLVYSASAVFAGYYFIVKKNFKDPIYIQLFNMYVTANAFWILVIRASFSNRFAYLSWFLMALIIFYPLLKEQLFRQQQKVLVYTLLAYFGFTYLMNVIIY